MGLSTTPINAETAQDFAGRQAPMPVGEASPKLPAVKPRKLALAAPSVELTLVPDKPQAIPGAGGVLILEASDVTGGHAQLMLFLSGRGPKDGVFVFNERLRKGQQMSLCLPDQQYVVSVRDVVDSATGKGYVAVKIAEGVLNNSMRSLPVEQKLSDAEEAEIRRIEAREKEFAGVMSGVSWFLIHAADEKKKMEAFQAFFSTKQFSEDDQCDVGTAIRRAGGTVNYRKSIAALLKSDDLAVRSSGAVLLGVLGDPNSAADLIDLVRAKDLPVQEEAFRGADRRYASIGLGILEAKQYTKELAGFLSDGNSHVRAGAAAALGYLEAKEYAAQIAVLLDDQEALSLFAAVSTLARLGAKPYAERIAGLLRRPARDISIPDAALAALMELDAKDQIGKIEAFRKIEVFHSGTAAKALAVLGAKEYAKDIAGMLNGGHGAGEVLHRRDALLALGILQAKEYAGDVVNLLNAEEVCVRRGAAWSLILMEDDAYGPQAVRVLEDEYYGSPIEISPHDLEYVPSLKFLEIQRRAKESLSKFKR
jgi:HEAT repeat protein